MGPEPEDFTGVELINLDGDFEPLNARWITKNTRRSLKEMPGNRNRVRKSSIKEPFYLTIVLEKKHFEYISKLAAAKACKTKQKYSVNSLIRECLEDAMPCPQTTDMFGDKK